MAADRSSTRARARRVDTAFLLPSLSAFNVSGVLSLAVVPVGLAFVALSFGLGRRVAGVAAVLSLTVSSRFGGAGLLPTFGLGLWSQQAAVASRPTRSGGGRPRARSLKRASHTSPVLGLPTGLELTDRQTF